jgi:hypothetical protein
MKKFENEFADHGHVGQFGPPYDASAPITCQQCLDRLDANMVAWLDTLTQRHKLPPDFWKGYTWR